MNQITKTLKKSTKNTKKLLNKITVNKNNVSLKSK